MELRIVRWSEAEPLEQENLATQIRDVFFLCAARKEFSSAEERNGFYDRWTKYYYENCPEDIWLAVDPRRRVAGYLTGCRDSTRALPYYSDKVKSYRVFEDLFEEFPAHLHINCHPEYQGRGAGRMLIEAFVRDIEPRLSGVHIVTAPDESNVRFYEKMGFIETHLRMCNQSPVFFMGKPLPGARAEPLS